MVNLNAQRNLPPDSTPWGKNIEKRLNDLEKDSRLHKSEMRNTDKGLNNLSKSVFGNTIRVIYQNEYQYFDFPANTSDNTFVLEPTITGTTRTGNILISGSIPIYMYNNNPTGSANMTGTLGWQISTEESTSIVGNQYGQIPFIPDTTLRFHEVGTSLQYAFRVHDLPTEYNFNLSLRLIAPQSLSRCDIRIPSGWSIITQQI